MPCSDTETELIAVDTHLPLFSHLVAMIRKRFAFLRMTFAPKIRIRPLLINAMDVGQCADFA